MTDSSSKIREGLVDPDIERRKHVHSLYGLYRGYVEHEDNLINQRSTWTYVIQSFLFAAYSLALQKKLELFQESEPLISLSARALDHIQWFLVIISAVGVVIGLVGTLSLHGAIKAINQLHETWDAVVRVRYADIARELPGLTGGGISIATSYGRTAPYLFPSGLILSWLVLLGISLVFWVPLGIWPG